GEKVKAGASFPVVMPSPSVSNRRQAQDRSCRSMTLLFKRKSLFDKLSKNTFSAACYLWDPFRVPSGKNGSIFVRR
ncbi:MAG: hypothetical protein ACE5ER_13130, partial [Nitrospinaceae bacterium]